MGFKLHRCRGLRERAVPTAEVRLAVPVRAETTMAVAMGTPGYLNNRVHLWWNNLLK